ncbi:MAG: hypothetical protein H0W88_00145 [Parachlamydiaceae bacterium]|nr:hypothetical protein [Parachlamydiaceae bacterium]
MNSTYISNESFNGSQFSFLFIEPYKEGIKNLDKIGAKPSQIFSRDGNLIPNPNFISLSGRVKHGIVGFILLIPIINTIAILILADLDKIPNKTLPLEEKNQHISQAIDLSKLSIPIEEPSNSADELYFNTCLEKLIETKVNGVKIIPTLKQEKDTTESHKQNCGYHALKNAFIAMYSVDHPDSFGPLFNDTELFVSFFNKYCMPLLCDKPINERDASTPMLRSVVELFRNDNNPPANLIELQKAFKLASDTCLSFFNVQVNASGSPTIGLVDEKGLNDAQKIYDFARNPGPSLMTMICGNENLGHWYTIIISKGFDNKITLYNCDSGSYLNQDIGQVAKLNHLIKVILHHQQPFMMNAYEDRGVIIERIAKHINDKGVMKADIQKTVLDTKPNYYLAIPDCTDGSARQLFHFRLCQSYEMMKHCGWLKNKDTEVLKHVNNLQKVLKFASIHIKKDDPFYSKLQKCLVT